MMTDKNSMGRRLRELRKAKGLTQVDVAAALDVSRSHITQVELGADPGFSTFIQLAKFYDVSLDYLFSGRAETPTILSTNINCQAPYTAEELALIELWREMNEGQRELLLSMIEKAVRLNVA